jgi:hypothetical protein
VSRVEAQNLNEILTTVDRGRAKVIILIYIM